MIGVDEAGRGPVFGSMFVAAVKANPSDIPDIVDDSKNLTNNQVADIATQLRSNDSISYAIVEVTSDTIDTVDDMTEVSSRAYAESASELDGKKVVLDAFTTTEKVAGENVAIRLPSSVNVSSVHGADEKFDCVSAASILAKDAREKHVEQLKERFGDIGSGYPSDPNTREFLHDYVQQNRSLPSFARQSWKTSKDALSEYGTEE